MQIIYVCLNKRINILFVLTYCSRQSGFVLTKEAYFFVKMLYDF